MGTSPTPSTRRVTSQRHARCERRSGIVLRIDAAREAALYPWEEREAGAALVAHDSPRIAKAAARTSIGSAVSAWKMSFGSPDGSGSGSVTPSAVTIRCS